MLVQTITMLWEPGTDAPSQIDYMIAEGTLVKADVVVATLPYKGVHMINVDSLIMWELETPIDADFMTLSIYDVDYPHIIDIDGLRFIVPAADNAWVQYVFPLEVPVPEVPDEPDIPVEPTAPTTDIGTLISSMLPILIVIPMLGLVTKQIEE